MADRVLDLSLKSGDADNITEAYVDKAYWLLVGHNEREEVRKALFKASELNAGANFVYYRLFNIYLLLGDYEKTTPLLKNQLITMSPFGELSVRASVRRARGEYDAAINDLETITHLGFVMDKIPRFYELAQCYFETGQNDKAIEAVEKMQRLYSFRYSGGPHVRAALYPRGFYLLGRIYERKGDTKHALENYERFLFLWKDSDRDLPEVLDARSHLASLVPESTREKPTRKNSAAVR
jgi:tetratricopeptide (TPR) repeat protein